MRSCSELVVWIQRGAHALRGSLEAYAGHDEGCGVATSVHTYDVCPLRGPLCVVQGLPWNYPLAVKGPTAEGGTRGLLSYGLTLLFLGVLLVSPARPQHPWFSPAALVPCSFSGGRGGGGGGRMLGGKNPKGITFG